MNTESPHPDYWQDAKTHLSAADPELGKVISAYAGDEAMGRRNDPFKSLVRSIIGQQISVKAASSIHSKVAEFTPITPADMHKAKEGSLRACGLSAQKVKYLKALAAHTLEGHLEPEHWEKDDTALINHLTELPGIGVWTAEMFLMFYLQRPDVFPVGDLGVTTAMNKIYFKGEKQKDKRAYTDIAANWQPYRSVASWYLWRSLENT